MDTKKLVWLGLFVGSTLGSFIPDLWSAGFLSFSSVLFSALGGALGIWLGFKLGD